MVNCLPFGLPQCRLITQGKQRIAGVALADVPGYSVAAKMAYLTALSKPDVKTLVEKSGFVIASAKGDCERLIVIPGDFLLVQESTDERAVWCITS
jgi:hypothetical protein